MKREKTVGGGGGFKLFFLYLGHRSLYKQKREPQKGNTRCQLKIIIYSKTYVNQSRWKKSDQTIQKRSLELELRRLIHFESSFWHVEVPLFNGMNCVITTLRQCTRMSEMNLFLSNTF